MITWDNILSPFRAFNPIKHVYNAKDGNSLSSPQRQLTIKDDNHIPFDDANVDLNAEMVLSLPAIFDGLRVLGDTMGSLKMKIYEETPQGRTVSKNHPWYFAINKRPNEAQAPIQYLGELVANAILFGKSYAVIDRTNHQFIPLDASRTNDGVVDGVHWVISRVGDEWVRFSSDDVIILSNFMERSIVKLFHDELSLAVNETRFANIWISNGGRSGGKLKIMDVDSMSDDEIKALRASIDKNYKGVQNAHKDWILPIAYDYVSSNFSAKEMQLLESRRYSVQTIARILNVPLAALKDLSGASYNSIEIQYKVILESITHFRDVYESEINSKVFTKYDAFYAEFITQSILKSDAMTQAEYILKLVNGGLMLRNEGRALLNLENLEYGDVPTMQQGFDSLENIISKGNMQVKEVEQTLNESSDTEPDYEKMTRARHNVDLRLTERFTEWLNQNPNPELKQVVSIFTSVKMDVENLIEIEINDDVQIGEYLIQRYAEFFMKRLERNTKPLDEFSADESIRFRGAVTKWIYTLTEKGTAIIWIGGVLDNIKISKQDKFSYEGKFYSHPDAVLTGEIFLQGVK